MGLAIRILLVDRDNHIYRMGTAKFDAMSRYPTRHPFPLFAGQRVRASEVIVELRNRVAVEIVRTTLGILTFDAAGQFDPATYERQQVSRFELAVAPIIGSTSDVDDNTVVVDAETRFIARGGGWTPSRALASAMRDAALSHVKCPRL
jgi:hypothetical protein